MYAFGVLVHELLSGCRPFEQVKNALQLGMMVFVSGVRPPLDQLPDDTPTTIIEMIKQCWDNDRTVRPSAEQCLATVESVLSLAQASMAAGSGLKGARLLLSPRIYAPKIPKIQSKVFQRCHVCSVKFSSPNVVCCFTKFHVPHSFWS